jgi:hypothetical protein
MSLFSDFGAEPIPTEPEVGEAEGTSSSLFSHLGASPVETLSRGRNALASIKTNNLTAAQKVELHNALTDNQRVDLNGVNSQSLSGLDRAALARDVIEHRPDDFSFGDVAEAGAKVFLGPAGNFMDQIQKRQPLTADPGMLGAVNSFANQFERGLTYNYDSNMQGILGMFGDTMDGRIRTYDDLLESYRGNRDLAKIQSGQEYGVHPLASILGQIGSGLTQAGPGAAEMIGARGAQLLSTLPKFTKYLANPVAQGTWYGLLYGSGAAEGDLTQGEFTPFIKDTATVLGTTILGALTFQNTLGRIAESGRLSFTSTGKEGGPNKEAMLRTIATNKGKAPLPNEVPEKAFTTLPTQVQSKAAESVDAALKYGLIEAREYGLYDTVTHKSGGLARSIQNFKDFFLKGSDFNYQRTMLKLHSVKEGLGSQMDDILLRAQGEGPHNLENVFGQNYQSKVRGAIANLSMGNDMDRRAAQQLHSLSIYMNSGKANDLTTLREIRQGLSKAIQFDSGTDPKFSTNSKLKDLYGNLNRYLDGQIRGALPDEYSTWKTANNDLSKLELFNHALMAGNDAKQSALSANAGYNQSVGQGKDPGATLLGAIGNGPTNLTKLALGTITGPFGRIPSAAINSTAGQPSAIAASISRVFPSYANGVLMTIPDKNIASYYIDNNGTLSTREKAIQKYKLNTSGEFDANNIPSHILNQPQAPPPLGY